MTSRILPSFKIEARINTEFEVAYLINTDTIK